MSDAISQAEKLTVTIKLQSDMCCGTGESDGSVVDQLTATDEYGLPIIPGKRLKGLLRENAVLVQGKYGGNAALCGAFGKMGTDKAKIKVSSAHLKEAASYKSYLNDQRLTGSSVSQQRVSDVFTSVRYNTAIDEAGIAKDHSLRAIQVINRFDRSGNITEFSFDIIGEGLSDNEKGLVIDSAKVLRRIGLNKNRGFGEVSCVPDADGFVSATVSESKTATSLDSTECAISIPYHIKLEHDVVLSGGIGQALDHFPGSMLQGAFARFADMGNPDSPVKKAILKGVRFSNAYLDVSGAGPSLPVPLSLVVEKNTDLSAVGARAYDISSNSAPDKQMVPVAGYCAVDGDKVVVGNVESGYSFHNSLPTSQQGKQFYSLKRIAAGQSFSGTLTGNPADIKLLCDVVATRQGRFSFGAATGTQFGACLLSVDAPSQPKQVEIGDQAVVEFLSDVIFIDSQGNNLLDVNILLAELKESGALGFDFCAETGAVGSGKTVVFCKTTTVGGYNAHWRLPKRQYKAFQKGTVLALTGCSSAKVDQIVWIGHLQSEGFGQIRIAPAADGVVEVNIQEAQTQTVVVSPSVNEDAKLSFKRALDFDEALLAMAPKSVDAASRAQLMLSRSASKRLFSVYKSACKTYSQQNAEDAKNISTLKEVFAQYVNDNFTGTDANKELKRDSENIICAFEYAFTNMSGINLAGFSRAQQDILFDTFMTGYLNQLKIRYLLKEGDNG